MDGQEKRLFADLSTLCAVAAGIHWFVEVPIHEYGHYWVATALGAQAYINGNETVWNAAAGLPALSRTLISLAGGVISGSILSALYFIMQDPYRKGLLPIIISEFAYAPFDATSTGYLLGLTALVIVWSLIVAMYLIRFLRGEPTGKLPSPGPQRSRYEALRLWAVH